MEGEAEAAGDVLTGGVVASAIENYAGAPRGHDSADIQGACRNCGATLTGAFCAACGQAAHIHRSLVSLGHDILHGVFHFEGKFWRTVPELFFHPGRLTRRYIDGERAKFVSPMVLFLFTVFAMFAVFSFTTGVGLNDVVTDNFNTGNTSAIEATEERIAALQEQRAAADLPPEEVAELSRKIADLESGRDVMKALAAGDWKRVTELREQQDRAREQSDHSGNPLQDDELNLEINLGWPALDRRLNEGVRQARDNPGLLFYKLKINSYKFSWALIPLSIPFLWLLFFWRRDIHLYDHAIFATYSISFMMLLFILLSIASSLGVSSAVWGTAFGVIPPIHMYKQLRGAYGLSRFGAYVRLFLLLIASTFVLTVFSVLLVVLGVLG